jgi:hypothetical protein
VCRRFSLESTRPGALPPGATFRPISSSSRLPIPCSTCGHGGRLADAIESQKLLIIADYTLMAQPPARSGARCAFGNVFGANRFELSYGLSPEIVRLPTRNPVPTF